MDRQIVTPVLASENGMVFPVFTWQSYFSDHQGKIATPNRGENIRDLARKDNFGISFRSNFHDAIALATCAGGVPKGFGDLIPKLFFLPQD